MCQNRKKFIRIEKIQWTKRSTAKNLSIEFFAANRWLMKGCRPGYLPGTAISEYFISKRDSHIVLFGLVC